MKKSGIRVLVMLIAAVAMISLFAGCGSKSSAPSNYADGTYSARSSDYQADEDGNGAGYGEVTIEIKDNAVVSCTFTMYELDGTVKDDSYGSELSSTNRLKAQKAVQAGQKYAEMLVDAGTLDEVDAISGATISYSQFTEAVNNALSEAATD